MKIPKELKIACLERKRKGELVRDIYNFFEANVNSNMSYESFRRKLNHWRKVYDNEPTVEGFKPKWGTVHYDAEGNIIQEWVRGDNKTDWQEDILEAEQVH